MIIMLSNEIISKELCELLEENPLLDRIINMLASCIEMTIIRLSEEQMMLINSTELIDLNRFIFSEKKLIESIQFLFQVS